MISAINQQEYFNLSEIKANERFDLIQTINGSLNDETWDVDTDFISRKYLYKPKNSQVFLIAKVAKKAIGYLIIREDYKEEDTSYLSYIAVHSDYQGRKIGSALLEKGIESIRQIGIQKLVLDCRKGKESFYKKFADNQKYPYSIKNIGKYRFGAEKMKVSIDLI